MDSELNENACGVFKDSHLQMNTIENVFVDGALVNLESIPAICQLTNNNMRGELTSVRATDAKLYIATPLKSPFIVLTTLSISWFLYSSKTF